MISTANPLPEPKTPATVREVYCDDDILVIDKPAGLPIHPSSRYLHGTVVGRLRSQYGEGFAAPVHRLDRETSGLVLCARNRVAARFLSNAFMHGRVCKQYVAVCEGAPRHSAFTVDAPLAVGGAVVRIGVRVDPSEGKAAQTCFSLQHTFVRDGATFSVWRAQPLTGRRHQIRAHLRHADLPIVGDKIYGHDENYYVRFCEERLDDAAWSRLRLPRQALHASRIGFAHPTHGRWVQFDAPWPDDLRAFVMLTCATARRRNRHSVV